MVRSKNSFKLALYHRYKGLYKGHRTITDFFYKSDGLFNGKEKQPGRKKIVFNES